MKRIMTAAALALAFAAGWNQAQAGSCDKLYQGQVKSLDNVNKRITVKLGDGSEQMIPTSNATKIDQAPGQQVVTFAAVEAGQFIRVCTEKGFATYATVMNPPAPKENKCDKLYQGVISKLDEVNQRITVKSHDGTEQMIPTSNATKIDQAPGLAVVKFSALSTGAFIRVCTEKGFATSATFMNASAGSENKCEKLYQGVVSKLDNVNKRITVKRGDGTEEMVPTSNATTIDQAPSRKLVTFAAVETGQFIRVCTERGFATSATIMNPSAPKENRCEKLYQGVISKLDEVNKRITVKTHDGVEQMIPTSNATRIDEAPGENVVQFSALQTGQFIRVCTEKGFATSATFLNPTASAK